MHPQDREVEKDDLASLELQWSRPTLKKLALEAFLGGVLLAFTSKHRGKLLFNYDSEPCFAFGLFFDGIIWVCCWVVLVLKFNNVGAEDAEVLRAGEDFDATFFCCGKPVLWELVPELGRSAAIHIYLANFADLHLNLVCGGKMLIQKFQAEAQ